MDAAGKGFLNLRLTNAMETRTGKSHLSIPLQVNYRADYLRAAIASDQAIAWRFVREEERWYAIATVEAQPAVIDRFGNPVDKRTIPTDLRGMPACKRLSLLRQAIAAIITLCQELQLPLAHEKLDFGNKKLANNGKKPNELLYMMPPRYSPR
jgi:hypothetical protein